METATSVSTKKQKAPAEEPKPQRRPRKIVPPEIVQDHSDTVEQTCTKNNAKQAKTASQELTMSISETSSKIHKLTSYEEAISDPIYGWQ